MARVGKLLGYDEMLVQYPDWILFRADLFHVESTSEATEASKRKAIEIVGHTVKFFQDHGLTKKIICSNAPAIPPDLKVYLRDVTEEGLAFYRSGQMRWLKRFERNMHADPSDVRIMERALAEMRSKCK